MKVNVIGLTWLNRDSSLNLREARKPETDTPALSTNDLSVLSSSIETAVSTLLGVDGQYPRRIHVTASHSQLQNSMSCCCGRPEIKKIKYSINVGQYIKIYAGLPDIPTPTKVCWLWRAGWEDRWRAWCNSVFMSNTLVVKAVPMQCNSLEWTDINGHNETSNADALSYR